MAPKFGNFCKFTAGEKLRLAGIVGFDEGKLAPTAQARARRGAARATLRRCCRVLLQFQLHFISVLAFWRFE